MAKCHIYHDSGAKKAGKIKIEKVWRTPTKKMQDVGQQYELKSGKNNKELTHMHSSCVCVYMNLCVSVCLFVCI